MRDSVQTRRGWLRSFFAVALAGWWCSGGAAVGLTDEPEPDEEKEDDEEEIEVAKVPAKVRQALMGGFASSKILEVHGERMIKRNFEPGFRIELHQKDLNLALEGARALGISLPSTAVAQQLFSSCAAHGGKAWDHSGMVRALEMMANHQVAKG
jgi:hypothetical protein